MLLVGVLWLLLTPKASDGVKGLPNQRHGNGGLDPAERGGVASAHVEGQRHGYPGPSPRQGVAPSSVGGGPAALDGVDRGGRGADRRWGPYAAAITRWESLTRPAPAPTDAAGRLRADFVEWMQGLDDGWITATPGLGRPAQLTALGNGVVPQQAAQALQLLGLPFPHCLHCADG